MLTIAKMEQIYFRKQNLWNNCVSGTLNLTPMTPIIVCLMCLTVSNMVPTVSIQAELNPLRMITTSKKHGKPK